MLRGILIAVLILPIVTASVIFRELNSEVALVTYASDENTGAMVRVLIEANGTDFILFSELHSAGCLVTQGNVTNDNFTQTQPTYLFGETTTALENLVRSDLGSIATTDYSRKQFSGTLTLTCNLPRLGSRMEIEAYRHPFMPKAIVAHGTTNFTVVPAEFWNQAAFGKSLERVYDTPKYPVERGYNRAHVLQFEIPVHMYLKFYFTRGGTPPTDATMWIFTPGSIDGMNVCTTNAYPRPWGWKHKKYGAIRDRYSPYSEFQIRDYAKMEDEKFDGYCDTAPNADPECTNVVTVVVNYGYWQTLESKRGNLGYGDLPNIDNVELWYSVEQNTSAILDGTEAGSTVRPTSVASTPGGVVQTTIIALFLVSYLSFI